VEGENQRASRTKIFVLLALTSADAPVAHWLLQRLA